MCYVYEKWCKIWKENVLSVQKWHEEFQKFATLTGCFWPKYIMLENRKYGEVMFDGTQDQYKIWRKTALCLQKWHEKFGKF